MNSKPAISNIKDPFSGPPKPFSFKYGVVDAESGTSFDHAQKQESTGVVTGKPINMYFFMSRLHFSGQHALLKFTPKRSVIGRLPD